MLGFGNIFYENNWVLKLDDQLKIYNRLQRAHAIFYRTTNLMTKGLVLNDGLVKLYRPDLDPKQTYSILWISLFLGSAIYAHNDIKNVEIENGFPGPRTVLSAGQGFEYIFGDIKVNDID